MNGLLILASFLAALPCWAQSDDVADSTLLVAMQMVHYYFNYELDVVINGHGNTTIVRQCRGSRGDDSCTFDEFVNYVTTGTVSQSPEYYEFESGYSMTIGDTYNILTASALRNLKDFDEKMVDRIIKGRKTATGLLQDMAHVTAATLEKAGSGFSRQTQNVKTSLQGVSYYAKAAAQGAMLKSLDGIRDVTWETARIASEFNQRHLHTKINWRATIARNSRLGNRNSDLFKTVSEAVRNTYKEETFRTFQTARKTADGVLAACH